MTKLVSFLLILLSFLGAGCSLNETSPIITLTTLYIDGDDTDYAGALDDMPILAVGDKVDVTLNLCGNGADLKTFQVYCEEDMKLDTLIYNESEVTLEKDFTDIEKGRLRFVDNIENAHITVRAKVVSILEDEMELSFYLSSKGEVDGAQYDLVLETEIDD